MEVLPLGWYIQRPPPVKVSSMLPVFGVIPVPSRCRVSFSSSRNHICRSFRTICTPVWTSGATDTWNGWWALLVEAPKQLFWQVRSDCFQHQTDSGRALLVEAPPPCCWKLLLLVGGSMCVAFLLAGINTVNAFGCTPEQSVAKTLSQLMESFKCLS